jgi:anthranilate synthase component I
MMLDLDRDAARTALEGGNPFLLHAEIADDTLTPVLGYWRVARPGMMSFLLESVEGGKFRGRYSIIGLDPDLLWKVENGRALIAEGRNAVNARAFEDEGEALFDRLAQLRSRFSMAMPEGVPAAASGLFGYLGFSMMGAVERLPQVQPDPVGCPQALMMRPTRLLVFDALKQSIGFFAPLFPSKATSASCQVEEAAQALLETASDLYGSLQPPPLPVRGVRCEPQVQLGDGEFETWVRRAKDFIAAGDVFQILPSQRFTAPFRDPPFQFYRALRRLNPSPFLFHIDFQDFTVIGSSPEILVRCSGRDIHVRPLAGTRPRGDSDGEDRRLELELLSDEKERAEHLMLIDLARNDVGRVAEFGSVRVQEQFVVERYSHVMHITSHVTGKLASGMDPLNALLSGFPAGTVSGAPKIRAAEIILELEGHDRGVYAGGIGYLSSNGDIDTCIALRTGVIRDGLLHVRAGAGVVADSVPELEAEETRNKARALFLAADLARTR